MTIDQLVNLTARYTANRNHFQVNLNEMNSPEGKKYYNRLINDNVSPNMGVYAFCHSENQSVLYIGKGGTIQNNGSFKNQNLNGRLKAPRGAFNNSFEYVKSMMNDNNFESLIILVLYSATNYPPAYIELNCLLEHLNQHGRLPMFNNEL